MLLDIGSICVVSCICQGNKIMKENKITITEFIREYPNILARVQYGGEAFTIIKYGRVAARLVPPSAKEAAQKRKTA